MASRGLLSYPHSEISFLDPGSFEWKNLELGGSSVGGRVGT